MATLLLLDLHSRLSYGSYVEGTYGGRPEHLASARHLQHPPSITPNKQPELNLLSPKEVAFYSDCEGKHQNEVSRQHSPLVRSLFSPLVESLNSGDKRISQSRAARLSTPVEIPPAQTSSVDGHEVENTFPLQDPVVQARLLDKRQNALHGPTTPVDTDKSNNAAFTDRGHEFELKKSFRGRPSSLSLSQGYRTSRRQTARYTVEVVGHHATYTSNKITGATGIYMACAIFILAITAAFQKGGIFSLVNAPMKSCLKCHGYGIEPCDICGGRGQITWEGKMRHADPCPLCFGSRVKKCSHCDGARMRRGLPPSLR